MATTHVDSDLLQLLAFESGREITMHRDHAELRIGRRLFVAPLAIPAQRVAGEES